MKERQLPGLEIRQEEWFVAGTTTGETGNAKLLKVQESILAAAGFSSGMLVTCKQVHSRNVRVVNDEPQRLYQQTDGLLTDRPGLVLGVFTADCLPIFLAEPSKRVVGILHSGWRGTVENILKEAVLLIRSNWGAEASGISVAIGPHIRQCCFQVGKEVAARFPPETVLERNQDFYVDLQKTVELQARECGIPGKNIKLSSSCTRCDPRFYSYRRNQTEDRMLSFITKTN